MSIGKEELSNFDQFVRVPTTEIPSDIQTGNIPERILDSIAARTITVDDALEFYGNFKNFMKELSQLERDHMGEHVASLNGKIVLAPTKDELRKKIENDPDSSKAFIYHLQPPTYTMTSER